MKQIYKIYGAPGTGKTTFLLNKLEDILKTYPPEEVAFVSFTRKGSYEGRERALSKFNLKEQNTHFFKTLHSLAFNTLGLNKYCMMDKKDYKEFSEKLGMNFVGYYTEDFKHNDDMYLYLDQLIRNNPVNSKNWLKNIDYNKLNFIIKHYTNFKKIKRLYDFTDIIEMFVNTCKPLPVRIAIVDEAQDLTSLQWKMVFKAFANVDVLYIAGDDDQAIYEWSGADVEAFLTTHDDNVNILKETYRLPNNVLTMSGKIANKIHKRISKDLKPIKTTNGVIKYITSLEELEIDNIQSWLMLSRNNCFLNDYKTFLHKQGLLYNYKGEPSFKKTDFNIIQDYQTFKKTGGISSMLKLNLKQGFDKNKEWYDNLNWPLEKIGYYRDLIKNGVHKTEPKININVNTIHTVKGGEADNVVIIEDVNGAVYDNLKRNADSELRTFYVAVTRTKQNLYILQSRTNKYFNFREFI